MLSAKDVAVVYETLLTSPGMNDAVKITLSVPRRNALLLAKIIESGLMVKDDGQAGFLSAVSKESLMELSMYLLIYVIGWYVATKILETFDENIYTATHFISGHSLKHFAAAVATWYMVKFFERKYTIN